MIKRNVFIITIIMLSVLSFLILNRLKLKIPQFNDLENKSEIRVIANTDSFISVITTNEDGRVGNVLCAYSSLMVKIISMKIQPHDFIAVFQP